MKRCALPGIPFDEVRLDLDTSYGIDQRATLVQPSLKDSQPVSQSISQAIRQSVSQSVRQSGNQSGNQSVNAICIRLRTLRAHSMLAPSASCDTR